MPIYCTIFSNENLFKTNITITHATNPCRKSTEIKFSANRFEKKDKKTNGAQYVYNKVDIDNGLFC